jgi:hypothetical protein
MAAIAPAAGSVPVIVRAYKSVVTCRIRRAVRPDFGWQARYHDRVVRDRAERRRIRAYIQTNPPRWSRDRNHPGRPRAS